MDGKTPKERVMEMLTAHGISARQLERDTGIGHGFVSRLDKFSPSAESLQKIADYLGTTIPYILYGREDEKFYSQGETAKLAQELFDNRQLSLLFDTAKDAKPEDLLFVHQMLIRLKSSERGQHEK